MCLSAIATGLSLFGTAKSLISSGDSGGGKSSATDAQAERVAAETKATQNAGVKVAMQRKAMRANSLFTGGGEQTGTPSGGRATLGV